MLRTIGCYIWYHRRFVTFVAVGVYEELLFRGDLITNITEERTWFERVRGTATVGLATLFTSVVFGVAHAGNPNATLARSVPPRGKERGRHYQTAHQLRIVRCLVSDVL
ncbi:CPBP family intramembrane glutamic endopeptidase [Haloarcula hispanica]|uniref:CPBP family intramembrane glutamic endopeptidase n=1 Tax=Haloarcula hispanica TaxID=51589 RepID=UPI0011B43CEC